MPGTVLVGVYRLGGGVQRIRSILWLNVLLLRKSLLLQATATGPAKESAGYCDSVWLYGPESSTGGPAVHLRQPH